MDKCLLFLMVMAVLSGCGNKNTTVGPQMDQEVIPQGSYSSLRPTIYYLPFIDADQDRCSSRDLRDLRNSRGQIGVTLCEKAYRNCLMQGSCLVLKNGGTALVNYVGKRGSRYVFSFMDRSTCPYGFGVDQICLDPYFSAAADLSVYKAGDVIFVSKLRGVVLPDGRIHDGYIVIRDKGANIKGADRFDFFTGTEGPKDPTNVFAKLGLADKNTSLQFLKVDENLAQRIRENRLYPRIR